MVATAQPRTPGHASSQGSGELLHFGLLKLRVCVPAASQRKDLTTMFFGRKKRNGFFFFFLWKNTRFHTRHGSLTKQRFFKELSKTRNSTGILTANGPTHCIE